MKLIGLFIVAVLVSCFARAEVLKSEESELAEILSNLVIIHDEIEFEKQGYSIKFFGNVSFSHCAVAEYCRSLTELLVVISEQDIEGPVISLYRLPKKHMWGVVKWEQLDNGKQGIYLSARSYNNKLPNSTATSESFLLATTWLSAEINAL